MLYEGDTQFRFVGANRPGIMLPVLIVVVVRAVRERKTRPYFLDTLWSDIDALCAFAGIHPVYMNYYRLFSKRFPYAVYHKIEKAEARVHAVLDCRRNPAWIRHPLT